jgi:hypothetical protein
VAQCKWLRIVDNNDIELLIQAASVLLRRRQIHIAFRGGEPAACSLEAVVDLLGDREERLIAVYDLPVGREAEITQERNLRLKDFGYAATVAGGIQVEHPEAL